MTTDVINRKILQLITYLEDMKPYSSLSFEEYYAYRYTVERLVQLFVDTAVDLLAHIHKAKYKKSGKTYVQTFLLAAELGIITKGLADNLAKIAKIRNELVHLYGDVKPMDVFNKMEYFIQNFNEFITQIKKFQ